MGKPLDYQVATDKPLVLIIMGVSGSGKSTLAEQLGHSLGIQSLDADDFHSEENKAHMASGQPLTDAMRGPWVDAIRRHLEQKATQKQSNILAFSGLRRAHRNRLRIANASVFFIFLKGSKGTIQSRMQARSGHFMPASLLDSQFATLEPPLNEPDVIAIDIDGSAQAVQQQALEKLLATGALRLR